MKCFDPFRTTKGEGTIQVNTDAKGRNQKPRMGLDTPLVSEENDVY